jgi:anti-sigma factor RsiW
MTDDEARALFDAAIDGELDAGTRAAFEATLAQDADLTAELARYRGLLEQARTVGRAVPPVDLLGSVQDKLRVRSGGRFYRDRFAARGGKGSSLALVLGLSVCIVLLVLLWFAYDAGLFAGSAGPSVTGEQGREAE